MKNLQSILEVTWVPIGADPAKTSTGARNMPLEMKNVINSLRRELKDNGIELGVISSAGRDAYNQGRVMYANWFDLPQNQKKQGETDEVLLARRKKYITGLYRGRKSVAVDKIFADAYRIGKDGKGGIKPETLKTALDNVETYLTANPISKHQGNGAIDVPSNSKLSNFIKSGKSKYAKSCLPESNHLHIALNIKASTTPYVKPTGTKENPIALKPVDVKSSDTPVDTPVDAAPDTPVSVKEITTDKFVKLRRFFGDKTIKISPANVSDSSSKIKKTAVVEYNNSVYSLSQMLNEKFGDGLKQKASKLLKGKQKNISLSNSSATASVKPTSDTDVKPKALEKPTFNLIYDKKSNLIQIEASNGEATNYIGYGIKNVTDQTEQHELANLIGIENFKTNQEIEAEEKEKGSFSSSNIMSDGDEKFAVGPSAARAKELSNVNSTFEYAMGSVSHRHTNPKLWRINFTGKLPRKGAFKVGDYVQFKHAEGISKSETTKHKVLDVGAGSFEWLGGSYISIKLPSDAVPTKPAKDSWTWKSEPYDIAGREKRPSGLYGEPLGENDTWTLSIKEIAKGKWELSAKTSYAEGVITVTDAAKGESEGKVFFTRKGGRPQEVYKRKEKDYFLKGILLINKDYENTGIVVKVVSDKVKKKAVAAASVAKYKKTHASASAGGKIKHSYKGDKAANISIIEKAASDAGITNPKSIIGMLTVIGKESNFLPKTEKMKYSVERLPEVWSRFSKTGKRVQKGTGKNHYNDLAKQYANDASKLGNLVYSGKTGNGNEASGDGYKYRGRGFNQITFKGTYAKYAKLIGKDILNKPDLLNDPGIAAETAVSFLLNRFKQKNIDPNSFTSVDDALVKYAKANAGWKSDATVPIRNARKYKKKFSEA